MIGVRGQWYLQAFLDGIPNDLLTTFNFLRFEMRERSGNFLPTFTLSFYSDNPNVVNNAVHEGAGLNIVFGRDIDDDPIKGMRIPLRALKVGTSFDGEGVGSRNSLVTLSGVYDALGYLSQDLQSFNAPSSVVIATEARRFFPSFYTNFGSTSDVQVWVQNNLSHRQFVNQLWWHGYVPDETFQVVGITSSGRFKLVHIPSLAKSQPKWNFSQNSNEAALEFSGEDVLSVQAADSLAFLFNGSMVTADEYALAKRVQHANLASGELARIRALKAGDRRARQDDDLTAYETALSEVSSNPESFNSRNVRQQGYRAMLPYTVSGSLSPADFQTSMDKLAKLSVLSSSIATLPQGSGAVDLQGLYAQTQQDAAGRFDSPFILFADFGVASKSGLLNSMAGLGRKIPYFDAGEGLDYRSMPSMQTLMATHFNRSSEMRSNNRMFSKQMRIPGNAHPRYWDALSDHYAKLTSFSSMQSSISIVDQFYPIEVLDLINIVVRDVDPNNRSAISAHSGLYIVTGVTRMIEGSRFMTHVEFGREGINHPDPKGSLS